jgi:mRNA interferase MazF
MRQYELWWADLPEPVGPRPVLLLSRDAAYKYLGAVLAVEVTTSIRVVPQELALGPREGVRVGSVANFDCMVNVPKRMLRVRVGALSADRRVEVKQALGTVLDWPELVQLA